MCFFKNVFIYLFESQRVHAPSFAHSLCKMSTRARVRPGSEARTGNIIQVLQEGGRKHHLRCHWLLLRSALPENQSQEPKPGIKPSNPRQHKPLNFYTVYHFYNLFIAISTKAYSKLKAMSLLRAGPCLSPQA